MVEGARLERVYTGNRIEGSNPSLSAISLSKTLKFFVFKVGHRSTHHSGRGRPGLSTICPNYAHAALFQLQPEASLLIA